MYSTPYLVFRYTGLSLLVILMYCIVCQGCAEQERGSTDVVNNDFLNRNYTYKDEIIDGMKFRIFYRRNIDSSALAIVNLTKEKLEVELLKKQLSK